MTLGKEEIKTYLRIDGDLEDPLLTTLQGVAETYLGDAGITQKYEKPTYKLAILMLIAHYYEHRGVNTESRASTTEIPFGLRCLIQQLQFKLIEEDTTEEVVT